MGGHWLAAGPLFLLSIIKPKIIPRHFIFHSVNTASFSPVILKDNSSLRGLGQPLGSDHAQSRIRCTFNSWHKAHRATSASPTTTPTQCHSESNMVRLGSQEP